MSQISTDRLVTLSELVNTTGKTRQAYQQRLRNVPFAITGSNAKAFRFSTLPPSIHSELDAIAHNCGLRDGLELLSCPCSRWEPVVSWIDATQEARDKAVALQKAMMPFLERFSAGNDDRSRGQFDADGAAAHKRILGCGVSGRWFRELFDRTIRRDRNHHNWQRPEIFLDDNAPAAIRTDGVLTKYDHSSLGHRLQFKDPSKPSLSESQNAFEYAFRHLDELAAASPSERTKIKASILRFIFDTAPSLSGSLESLRRNFDRKYRVWLPSKNPSAIADERPGNSGNFRMDDLEADLQLIVKTAFEHDGKLAIAIRKLRRAGKLSATFINRYTLDLRRNKSYVPRSVRKEIQARLEGLLNYRRSQWQVAMHGPRITREHNYNPGDFFAADDCTFNVAWWYVDDHGRPAITRGEVLLFFDCRSLYPLGYIMVPGKYNGETVRRGILHIHDRHGLPHRAFIFEKGVWASRMIVGSHAHGFLGWDEYEMGLRTRGLGVELRNVTTPQGKLIEGIFNIIQQNQRDVKGFVGFNEREYGQERLQKFIGQVKRGLVHPSKEFHSDVEWGRVLDRSLEYYAHDPQNGALLRGASPAEMFAQHSPLRKLPDRERFLLASHRVRAMVKATGVTVTIRGQRRDFYNQELGERFLGREVYAWFNVEHPDLLTVTDLEMKNPFSIKRNVLPAFTATPEQKAVAFAQRGGFLKESKQRFDAINHPVRRSVTRDNVLSPDGQALGSHIRQETEKHAAAQTAQGRSLARLARTAEATGSPIPDDFRNADRVRRGMEMMKESGAEIARGLPPSENSTKIYIIDQPDTAPPAIGQYWSLWAKIEKATPGMNRHSLTRKTLGVNPNANDLNPAQLAKMIEVFRAVLRDATLAAT